MPKKSGYVRILTRLTAIHQEKIDQSLKTKAIPDQILQMFDHNPDAFHKVWTYPAFQGLI